MAYTDTLTATQKRNAEILNQQMQVAGITNPYTKAAILAVVSKESSFIPQSENLNYSAKRITEVWPKITLEQANKLQNNPQALGDYVYGPTMNPSLGNGTNEGYKYRGRGFNQITGKANYRNIGSQIGVNLVDNPDLLNDPKVAADAAILFFKNGINSLSKLGKLSQYNATNINDFKTEQDSLGAIYHVNAGVGSTKAKLDADVTGGKAKATSRVTDLYNFIVNTSSKAIDSIQNNPIPATLITAGTLVFFL